MFKRIVASFVLASFALTQSPMAYAGCSSVSGNIEVTNVPAAIAYGATGSAAVGGFLLPIFVAISDGTIFTKYPAKRWEGKDSVKAAFIGAAIGGTTSFIIARKNSKTQKAERDAFYEAKELMDEARTGFGKNVRDLHESVKQANPEVSLADVVGIIRKGDDNLDLCRHKMTGSFVREYVQEAVISGKYKSEELKLSGAVASTGAGSLAKTNSEFSTSYPKLIPPSSGLGQ
jgi:hypothetical protein